MIDRRRKEAEEKARRFEFRHFGGRRREIGATCVASFMWFCFMLEL